LAELVKLTEGYSGREIERLVKQVTSTMISELNADLPDVIDKGLAQAKNYQVKVRPLNLRDFQVAAEGIRPVTSPEEAARYLDWRQDQD